MHIRERGYRSVCNDSYINSGTYIKWHRYTVGGHCVNHCNFYLFKCTPLLSSQGHLSLSPNSLLGNLCIKE